MEWYSVYIVVRNQLGETIWQRISTDYEAMNDEDARRKMDNNIDSAIVFRCKEKKGIDMEELAIKD